MKLNLIPLTHKSILVIEDNKALFDTIRVLDAQEEHVQIEFFLYSYSGTIPFLHVYDLLQFKSLFRGIDLPIYGFLKELPQDTKIALMWEGYGS